MGTKRANQKSKSSGNLKLGAEPNEVIKKQSSEKLSTQMMSLTKDQLKTELKKRGLKVTGTKNELLQRLGNVMASVKRKAEVFNNTQSNGATRKLNSRMFLGQNRREEERMEREKIVLWRRPVQTLTYFYRELNYTRVSFAEKAKKYRATVIIITVLLAVFFMLLHTEGPHQNYCKLVRGKAVWCLYWLGLGVLSSVGLGTGLHTFLLYLGPHIASVTLAAYECGALNFPEPPYPDEIVCPEKIDLKWGPSIFNIMSKVRLEAMMWGIGTALGELPPYFMARAARLSGYDPDDKEDLREFEELRKKRQNAHSLSLMDRAKISIEKMVEKVGFLGILACASTRVLQTTKYDVVVKDRMEKVIYVVEFSCPSETNVGSKDREKRDKYRETWSWTSGNRTWDIRSFWLSFYYWLSRWYEKHFPAGYIHHPGLQIPNPLFDLAGITCGHFLVPFWTFFGATVLGKAIIKMHIQKMFVIIAFNESLVEKAVAFLGHLPSVGHKLQEPFKAFLIRQKLRLHRRSEAEVPAEGNLVASVFEKFVLAMVIYFVMSIVNSLAQSYYKRICKERRNPKQNKD